MKTTHELVCKRFADLDQDVCSAVIWKVTIKVFKLKPLYPKLTREQMIEILVPDYRAETAAEKDKALHIEVTSKLIRRFSLIGRKAFDGEIEGAVENVIYFLDIHQGDIDTIIEDMYRREDEKR